MESRIYVNGGNQLNGEIEIDGSKNSALVCMVAACLNDDGASVTLNNVPRISDVFVMADILRYLGKTVNIFGSSMTISGTINKDKVPSSLSSTIRASIYCAGALLGICGSVETSLPGGDKIGARPIDIHLDSFEQMGARYETKGGKVYIKAPEGLKGAHIFLRFPSVGATCNIILAAVRANGKTIIENAAKEPEIVDFCSLLMKMGCIIHGAGTDRIVVVGANEIHGDVEHDVIADRIEAGVFAVATAITGGDVYIKNMVSQHNRPLISTLSSANVICSDEEDGIRIRGNKSLYPLNVNMMPFPGLATDLQPLMTVLALQATGDSIIVDNVFPERFQYVYELIRMGAEITHYGNSLRVTGGRPLIGMAVEGTDIRAVTALICAGLIAEDTTEVEGLKHLERGYVDFDKKLKMLGADITIG